MALTVTAFRERLVALLESAITEVRKYEEQLVLFDSIMQGETVKRGMANPPAVGGVAKQPKTQAEKKAPSKDDANVGKLIRKTFLDMGLEETFNVPKVVGMVQPKFSNMSKDSLSKSVSGIARRLEKAGKIKIITKGSGRKPHTYQRVS